MAALVMILRKTCLPIYMPMSIVAGGTGPILANLL